MGNENTRRSAASGGSTFDKRNPDDKEDANGQR